jgi:hypothetical protein
MPRKIETVATEVAANEVTTLRATGAGSGDILTADGSGGSAWAAPNRDDYATAEEYETAYEAWVPTQDLSGITHDGTHKRSRKHHGLIAQEVKQAIDALGVDFGGYQDHSIAGGQDVRSVGYQELIAPMIKAIQEQQALISDLQNRLTAAGL